MSYWKQNQASFNFLVSFHEKERGSFWYVFSVHPPLTTNGMSGFHCIGRAETSNTQTHTPILSSQVKPLLHKNLPTYSTKGEITPESLMAGVVYWAPWGPPWGSQASLCLVPTVRNSKVSVTVPNTAHSYDMTNPLWIIISTFVGELIFSFISAVVCIIGTCQRGNRGTRVYQLAQGIKSL